MDTTVDLADSGRNTPLTKSRRAARQTREARIRWWRVFVVSSFFAVVLGANLFVGATVIIGHSRAQADLEKAAARGQTAQIRRPLLDGTFCRNIVFDNKTAQSIEDKVERCEQPVSKPKAKRKTAFSWGGK